MSKNIEAIVREWLAANGYDGLYNEDACGCELADLMPCGEPNTGCMAGYRIPCDPETCQADGDCPWHIGPRAADTGGGI